MYKNNTEIEKSNRMKRINNYLDKFLKLNNISEMDLNKQLLDEFVKKYLVKENRINLYTNITVANEILEDRNINIKLSSNDYTGFLQFKANKYFTKKEIRNICDMFINPQDKFIVYALWSGIMGKGYEDLANIKTSDIAADFSNINIKGKKFECDDYMKDVLKDTVDTDTYIKYIESASSVTSEEYEFNMGSNYVIKVKPSIKNNNGMNPIRTGGIHAKLKKLSELTEMNLTGIGLVKSGIMYKMFVLEAKYQVLWGVQKIEEYLTEENIPGQASDLYRLYHNKYHNSNTLSY